MEPDWKAIALYLADCHAATADGEGMLSRTSKGSRKRFRDICLIAQHMITGENTGVTPRRLDTSDRYQARVIGRLASAAEALDE